LWKHVPAPDPAPGHGGTPLIVTADMKDVARFSAWRDVSPMKKMTAVL